MATRTAWVDVYEELHGRELSSLAPEHLEALADAAWWTSRVDEAIAVRQRAYTAYAAAGNGPRAAYSAWFLFWDHTFRDEEAVANGWLRRASRHLASEPECVEHGYLEFAHGAVALWGGRFDDAFAAAERAIGIGERAGSPDVVALGIECRGRARIGAGRNADGIADLDEAMCSVIAGELSPLFTGWVYCNVLEACWRLADLRRAGEWTDAALRWCEGLPGDGIPFRGLCRIHRVELATLRGAWDLAEVEARRTCEELLAYEPHAAGMAFNAAGELRRRAGDLAGAEEAFARAHALGYEPQPGLALVQVARGRPEAAAAALRLSLATEPSGGFPRAQLLAAQVEAELEAGDPRRAAEAVSQLETLAGRIEAPAVEALAAGAAGALRLAQGRLSPALASLRRAVATWQRLGAPYEAALARVRLATVARLLGDDEGARLELDVARAAFRRLGASGDARRAERLLGAGTAGAGGVTAREVEVLRLVARGKTNREIAAELVISDHTVARHLNNIFRKLGVTTRAGATAYAFTHGLLE